MLTLLCYFFQKELTKDVTDVLFIRNKVDKTFPSSKLAIIETNSMGEF